MGGMMASSSPSATAAESGAYSSLSASTMERWISSSLGNEASTRPRHSPAVLPDGTSTEDSATPVRSRARAKKSTFTLTASATVDPAAGLSAGAASGSIRKGGGSSLYLDSPPSWTASTPAAGVPPPTRPPIAARRSPAGERRALAVRPRVSIHAATSAHARQVAAHQIAVSSPKQASVHLATGDLCAPPHYPRLRPPHSKVPSLPCFYSAFVSARHGRCICDEAKVFDEMPPAGLLARRVVSARADTLARSLPPLGAGTRWLHGGGDPQDEEFPYADVPRPGRKQERKPYVTPMKALIRRAKEERRARRENPCRVLEHPPGNGLLVPHLVEVAHRVHGARERLLDGLTRLVEGEAAIPVKRCRFCSELHIGHIGHEIRTCEGRKSGSRNSLHVWRPGTVRDVVGFPYCYHLFDRVGKPRVVHKEKYDVPRLPAILELCIQAGVDVERFPTKRRTRPVYSIEGRIADFEPDEEDSSETEKSPEPSPCPPLSSPTSSASTGDGADRTEEITVSELSSTTLQSWLDMRSGAARLMRKYGVVTCGYCPDVQVGPKGHKVRMCKASKHQQRDGQHAWQEATVDDLVPPNYVWHVRDPVGVDGPPLANELKRYYGKAPAVVELCVRAGAQVPAQYRSMMRLDVVPPARDEYDLVA